eukprot:5041334-Prymnesium_polylepis.1
MCAQAPLVLERGVRRLVTRRQRGAELGAAEPVPQHVLRSQQRIEPLAGLLQCRARAAAQGQAQQERRIVVELHEEVADRQRRREVGHVHVCIGAARRGRGEAARRRVAAF